MLKAGHGIAMTGVLYRGFIGTSTRAMARILTARLTTTAVIDRE